VVRHGPAKPRSPVRIRSPPPIPPSTSDGYEGPFGPWATCGHFDSYYISKSDRGELRVALGGLLGRVPHVGTDAVEADALIHFVGAERMPQSSFSRQAMLATLHARSHMRLLELADQRPSLLAARAFWKSGAPLNAVRASTCS
jgi:hypothetical protein